VLLRCAGRYNAAYWFDERPRRWRKQLRGILPVDLILVNDLPSLPFALGLGSDAPIVLDAHEHWTSESASWTRAQRLSMRHAHEWIVDHCVPQIGAMMTVSLSIARAYQRRTGLAPVLVTNAPPFQDLRPLPVSTPIRLLHLGVADERRRLEDTINAVSQLGDRFTLDLVLRGENSYRERLEMLAASNHQIRVLEPVTAAKLHGFANSYDVGLHLLPADSPNMLYALPNKLFDYIQARLAVAIGPSPEMAEIVREWGCGVISDTFEADDFARALDSLSVDKVQMLKQNADRAARVLTAENNGRTLVDVVDHVIRQRVPA
jgi:hypothetical protein